MENSVTNRQTAFILLLTVVPFTSVNIPKLMAQSAGAGSWTAILLTALLFAFAAWLWARLNAMHPGRMLFDYGAGLVGKFAIYLIAAYLAQYFFTVLVNLTLSTAKLLKANFLPRTPEWATMLAALPVFGFVAWKGVTNVARLVEIYGVVFLAVALAAHAIMLIRGDLMHILPLFNPADTGKYLLSVKDAIYPFLGAEVLSVLPVTQKFTRGAGKTAFLTLLFIGAFYVLVVESSFMTINISEIVHYDYPLITAIRQVELPVFKVFQRLDVLYLTAGFIGLFGGLSIVYMSVVEFVCRFIPKARRGIVVAAVGAAAFAAFMALRNIKGIERTLVGVITVSGVISAFIIPLALFIAAKARNHDVQKAA